jgi:hypothetical protein
MQSATRKLKVQDDPGTRARVKQLVRDLGVAGAARVLGLSRDATLALAADADVRAGTFAQAREGLAAFSAL